MSDRLQEFKLATGESIWVELRSAPGAIGRRDAAEPPAVAPSFERAWGQIKPAMAAVMERVKELAPGALEVKFAVKMSAEVGAIFAAGSAEANFEVTLKWSKEQPK